MPSSPTPALIVEPASSREVLAAFQIVFQDVPEEHRDVRVLNGLRMVQAKELDSGGVVVARKGSRLVGAMVCLPTPGASGLVWPPRVVDETERTAIEDALLQFAIGWLRQRGAKLGQALLSASESQYGPALIRNGFVHPTSLRYMQHTLELDLAQLRVPERLSYYCFDSSNREQFGQTLLRSYECTLDCPEVSGIRTLEETLAGHQAQGLFDPGHWWLAYEQEKPVGVLLLAEMPDFEAWDISYVGLVPEARGKGYGNELIRRALRVAKLARAGVATVSVDARNRPAVALYEKFGFTTFDAREVYLAFWAAERRS